MRKPIIHIIIVLIAILLLAGCGGSAPEVVTVEVTRVVTETVEVEGEAVEVTVVVVETVVEEAEIPAAEEEAMEEADSDALEEAIEDDLSAIGSEDATGDGPPPPDTGPKVESTPSSDTTTENAAEVEVRSVEAEGDTAVSETVSASTDTALSLDQGSRLTAGEVDDNAQWDDYLLYLRNYSGAAVIELDVSERHQISVTDSQGAPVLGARISILANEEEQLVLRTHSDGTALFFPKLLPSDIQTDSYNVQVTVNGQTETFTLTANEAQREWQLTHPGADQQNASVNLDVLFLIDATGSMSDEINQLKENIEAIAAQIDALPAQPDTRYGMVTYRDREDLFVTAVTDFTPDVVSFSASLADVQAAGGGDYPEDLNEALSQAIHQPEWRVENTVSLIFLVADAPPHLDYGQQNHYGVEVLKANSHGIKIYPIASSGLDSQGEYIFRQLAQITNGRFIFLTYGSDGPGSTGTETEFSVDDYTVSSLDQIIVQIVEGEVAHQNQ